MGQDFRVIVVEKGQVSNNQARTELICLLIASQSYAWLLVTRLSDWSSGSSSTIQVLDKGILEPLNAIIPAGSQYASEPVWPCWCDSLR
jgi:hypothetical protein